MSKTRRYCTCSCIGISYINIISAYFGIKCKYYTCPVAHTLRAHRYPPPGTRRGRVLGRVPPMATEEAMIATAAAAIRHWEQGNEQGYRSVMHANATMRIPAYGVDIQGINTIWGIRQMGGSSPLAIHTLHTAYVAGRTVIALSTIYSRETGAITQHAELKYTFDDAGKIVLYEQDVLWKA